MMKPTITRKLLAIWLAMICGWLPAGNLRSQTNSTAELSAQDAEEKEQCIRNLKLIYEAIQAYRADHKDVPNWLSDLVPQYITDANMLVCPVCRRTGQIENSPFADPKISSSYLYQFCPVPLTKPDATNTAGKTYRDLNRQLMSVTGPMVPLVRCWHHNQVLNLSYEGKIYESGAQWLDKVSAQNASAEVSTNAVATNSTSVKTAARHSMTGGFAARDAQARPQLIDLSDYYNANLSQSWLGGSGDDLAALPTGLQTLGGIQFDIRGIIQLAGSMDSMKRFPRQVLNLKVHQKCERLHFLTAAAFGGMEDNGHKIGAYIVHFATNQMQLEVPIHYGTDVRNWHTKAEAKPKIAKSTEIWTGTNPACEAAGKSIRLFATTWVNVAAGIEIESIDFVSTAEKPAPFLIAITAE